MVCSGSSFTRSNGTRHRLASHLRSTLMIRTFDGGCACGTLRYRMRSAPMFVHCCHCKDCQRQTGSAFVLNALIETDRMEISHGQTALSAMPTDSGRSHDIARCTDCGTAVWSHYGGLKKLT